MIVVPPNDVNTAEIVASDIPEIDFTRGEEAWTPLRDTSISTLGITYAVVDTCEYNNDTILAIDGTTGNVYRLYRGTNYSSDWYEQETLFTIAGRIPRSIAYDSDTDTILIVDNADNFVYSVDLTGATIDTLANTAFSNTKIAYYAGGYVSTASFGGSCIATFFVGVNAIDSFNIYNSEIAEYRSCVVVGELLYCLGDNGYVDVFNLFTDNAAPIDRYQIFVTTGMTGLSYSTHFNCLYAFDLFLGSEYVLKGKLSSTEEIQRWRAGDQCIYQTYKAICKTTETKKPPIDATDWEIVGAEYLDDSINYQFAERSNKYKAFDQQVNQQSIDVDTWTQTYRFSTIVDTIGLINATGTQAQIIITDDIDGELYNETFELINNNDITDYYEYYFYPLKFKKTLIVNGLPLYSNVDIEVIIKGSGDVGVGRVVMGQQTVLGTTNYGTGGELLDYSQVNFDDFGNISVVKRNNVKNVDYDVTVPSPEVNKSYSSLSGLTTTPCLWLGVPSGDDGTGGFTTTYGIYDRLSLIASNYTQSEFNLRIKGLV